MKINVTENDIKNGKRNNPNECPIALAINRRYKNYTVSVGPFVELSTRIKQLEEEIAQLEAENKELRETISELNETIEYHESHYCSG